MDRSQSSVIPKDLVEYANAVVPQQDAIHRCPALIVLKEENNNNNRSYILDVYHGRAIHAKILQAAAAFRRLVQVVLWLAYLWFHRRVYYDYIFFALFVYRVIVNIIRIM